MTASSPTRSSAAAAGRPRCWPRWRPQVPDPQAAGDMYPLTELLSGATGRTVLAEAPGKSGATLERMVIGGQDYVLKQLDLADDWTMRASGCLRGAPLVLWERGILSRLPGCFNQPIVAAVPLPRGAVLGGGCALLMRDVPPWLAPPTDFPGQHARQVTAFGLVDVRRLDHHQQPSGRPAELAGHVLLQRGELDQVAVALGAEVDAVRVADQLDRAAGQPEIEQADAGDVAGVGVRLQGGDGRRPGGRIVAPPVDDPRHLVPAGVLVVEEPGRVAVRAAEHGDLSGVGKVGVHPGQPLRFGVTGDDLVRRVGPRHHQRHQRDLPYRLLVVPAGDAVGQDPPRDREPRRPDGVRGQGVRPVTGEFYRHDRIVCNRVSSAEPRARAPGPAACTGRYCSSLPMAKPDPSGGSLVMPAAAAAGSRRTVRRPARGSTGSSCAGRSPGPRRAWSDRKSVV